jgi:hypothetical protein
MKNAFVPALLLMCSALSAQTPVSVYSATRKIAPVSEDTMYLSFAKGDQLILDFESTTGRELMEFELLQYPHYSKFRKDNQVKMKGEKISITATGVYWFRMANRSGTERNCKLNIWRTPASAATKNFKTTVSWKTISDTTYKSATEIYLARKDTVIVNRESIVTVYGTQTRYGSTTQCPDINLPGNAIAWSYYIGVNQPGLKAYQEAEQKFKQASDSPSKIPGYGPVAALALHGKSFFTPIENSQAISYSIVNETNATLAKQQQPFKSFRAKKASNDFSVMKEPLKEKCFFFLRNETDANLDVIIKVAAVVVYERWAERPVQKMEILRSKVPIVPTKP